MRAFTSNNASDSPDSIDQTNETAILIDAVSIRYHLFNNGRPQLQDYAAALFARRKLRREVWALRNVTLNVRRGEVFGLCGSNGSGKSTLLKVIARILRPTEGRVVVRGRVAPLIELGAGFQHELTGRENILLKSAILGYSERDTLRRVDRIVDFAGLREFIDAPIRTYSSGMLARLAFAVATDVQPDILIVDEVLAVGDAEFRERSEDRIDELRRAGATVMIVSHNSGALRRLCDRVAWLAYGSLQMSGEPAQIIRAYESGLRSSTTEDDDNELADVIAPPTVTLRSDDTMFMLELPGTVNSPLVAAVAHHFDPQHIGPFHSRAEIPAPLISAVAPFRLLHGTFFYDQALRMLQRTSVFITELYAPPIQTKPGAWATADNPLTRLFGQRADIGGPIPLDQSYLMQELTQADIVRASAALDQLPFVGLAERPLESLLLLWYTFGWLPPRELPPLFPNTVPPSSAEVPNNSSDAVLYARVVRRFNYRFALMAQDLIERYGGPLTEKLEPPYPLELLHGLLRARYDRMQAKLRQQPAIRFTFDRPVPGTGWYGVEYSKQHGTFRWTGPDLAATIQIPIDRSYIEQDLILRCRILLASRPSVLRSLRFTVNRRMITITQTRSWDGSIICEGVIPYSILAGSAFAQIALEVDRTEVPPANGTEFKETRQLGVAVSWLELAPIVPVDESMVEMTP
jgi:ABC-type polysaccharide/polyol phosphate transport system ATPase subunit